MYVCTCIHKCMLHAGPGNLMMFVAAILACQGDVHVSMKQVPEVFAHYMCTYCT